MNIFRITLIVFSLAIVVNCGGGGSSGTATPTTMNPPTANGGGGQPTGPQALPTALITDPSAARNFITDSTAPTTTVPMEIQAAFQMEAMDADTFIDSDAFVNGANISAGGGITLNDFTFTSSLENIRMGVADRFNLEGVSSQYSPVMDHSGITFAQYQAAGRTGNDVLEYQSYGGWITNSAFSVDMLTIDRGSREDSILIGVSYGDATGSRPTGTGSGEWKGSAVGVHKTSGDVIQGTAEMAIVNLNTATNINIIQFVTLKNLNGGNNVNSISWNNVPIATDGTFSSTTGGDINGAFYGAQGTEAGGTFNHSNIIGAFGATKQ